MAHLLELFFVNNSCQFGERKGGSIGSACGVRFVFWWRRKGRLCDSGGRGAAGSEARGSRCRHRWPSPGSPPSGLPSSCSSPLLPLPPSSCFLSKRAVAYIPLTILAVPAAVLSLGGGYLFGLPIGFFADSIGATLGSVAAFLLGRTLGRPYVVSKMNDYPDFQAVAVAIERSGFKIVLLLRLAPLVPFCLLNYFLSVTPIGFAEYTMASWLGMMPITLVLVYVGTTLDDLADVTHGWSEVSTAHWGTMVAGLLISAILMVCVTREAQAALQKALAENLEAEDILVMPPSPWLPSLLQPSSDLRQPLMIKIET